MKHIAFYVPLLQMGGAEKVVIDVLNQIVKVDLGNRFFLIVDDVNSELMKYVSSDVKILPLKNRNMFGLGQKVFQLNSLLKHNNIDLTVAHLTHSNLHMLFTSFFFRDITTKLVLVEHSILSDYLESKRSFKHRVISLLVPFFYKRSDKIIAVSESVKQDLVKFWDVPPELVIKIFNPINVDLILKLADEEITDNYFESQIHKKKIVNIGRLEVEKNHMLLLEAVDLLRYERNDFVVLIIGDGSMRPMLAEFVDSNNLADYVKFLGHKMNPYKYLKLAHTFVLPSSFEGFGIVLIEALCLQKNIVSTDISASREVLEDQLHGVLCQHTPRSMAIALNDSLNVVGQKTVPISQVEKYKVEVITDQYIKTFNGILCSDSRS